MFKEIEQPGLHGFLGSVDMAGAILRRSETAGDVPGGSREGSPRGLGETDDDFTLVLHPS